MDEFTLDHAQWQSTDFKKCVECGRTNWHENELCTHCSSTKFRQNNEIGCIKKDYKFYRNEGYSEDEIDNTLIEP